MSGPDVQWRESDSHVQRGEARRYLLGLSGMYLGAALMGLAGLRSLRWLGAVVAITCAVLVILSRAQTPAGLLTPRALHGIARVAEVPGRLATVVVYACIIAGLVGAVSLGVMS
jgi:uncharacterized membrane protein